MAFDWSPTAKVKDDQSRRLLSCLGFGEAGSRNSKAREHPIKCFLQVNISGEESKHRFAPDELDDVLAEIAQLDKIEIVGLMTMAPFEASQEELQDIFQKNSPTSETTRKETIKNMPFSELSMGMSRDFEVAKRADDLC